MKKYLFLISMAALTFTSCSDQTTEFVGDEVAQQAREITFSPVAQPNTRAFNFGINGGTTLDNEQPIYVSAYSIPGSGDAAEYFSNVTFERSSTITGNPWHATSTAQYWPLSPVTMNFLGVTGVPAANVGATNAGESATAFTSAGADITWTHNGALANDATMYDLMYASGRGTVAYGTGAGNENKLVYGNNVSMVFKHALAQIVFNTAVGSSSYASAIHIDKIILNDMVKAATYTLSYSNNTSTDAATVSGTWAKATSSSTDNIEVPGSNAYASTDMSETLAANGKVLVPCKNNTTTFDSFSGFTVYFTINGSHYTYHYTPAAAEKVLAQGKKYVYNITLSLTEILIAPSVQLWNDDNNDGDTTDDGETPTPIVVPIPATGA